MSAAACGAEHRNAECQAESRAHVPHRAAVLYDEHRPRPVRQRAFMTTRLDRWHHRLIESRWRRTFTIIMRVLLALGFMPSGWVKLAGHRFTTLPTTDPVGYFFDGFFSATGYYRFIGAAQLAAAFLLLFPRTAALGAATYFPIILNIFVITISIGAAFAGTRIVTGLMLLASTYLLLWDYDRWKGLLPSFVDAPARDSRTRHGSVAISFGFLAAAAIGLTGVTELHLARLRHLSYIGPSIAIAAGALIGLLTLLQSLRAAGATLARNDNEVA